MMHTAIVKAVLVVVCCHCIAVENLVVVATWSSPNNWAISQNLFAFVSPPRRTHRAGGASRVLIHRTRTIAAAIMSPEESSSGIGALSDRGSMPPTSPYLPNWRVVDVHNNNGEECRPSCSPFCHPLSPKESNAATATAAPWSQSAYNAALNLHDRLKTCTDPYIAPILKSALHDMEMAYRLYGPFCMIGSYNGGKDAVVIFHLMRAVHAHYCRSEMQQNEEEGGGDDNKFIIPRPRVIYFQHPDEFPEVLSLLDETVEKFDVDMLAFKEGVSFGEGLKYLVERNISPGKDGLSYITSGNNASPSPHPLAFVLGTRKNDPNAGSQGIYAPSSHYMPPFLRVNPILDWTYGHVWHFLRTFELPYCSLYDDGYTSLGTVKDTLPCPALKKDGDGEEYWPAYMLRDWDLERAGRIDKKKAKDKSEEASEVSLPADEKDENDLPKMTETMSRVMNIDSDDDDADSGSSNIESPMSNQFSSIGRPTVGLIVIGDEILKGMTPDSNIISAAKALRSNNVSLSRVSIIPDDRQEIVDEIQRFTKEVDVIITSGGIGPTHDDVTIKSVAEALGLDMEMHHEMAELLLEKMGSQDTEEDRSSSKDGEDPRDFLIRQMSEGQRKMSVLPTESVLKYIGDSSNDWPILQVKGIFILPGVPTYFEKKINQLASYLPTVSSTLTPRGGSQEEDVGLNVDQESSPEKQSSPPPRSDTYRIVLSLDEEAILSALNASVAAHPHVSFGSYPIVDDPDCRTIITIEGRWYSGGYTKRSQRLLEKSATDKVGNGNPINNKNQIQSLFFSKEEMDRNVANALQDLKSRLPDEGILCIDSCDNLRIK